MSDATRSYYCTSSGFFTNKKTLALRREVKRHTRILVPLWEVAPLAFQYLLAYSSLNQLNGNLRGYKVEDFQEIFKAFGLALPKPVVVKLKKALEDVGFIKGGQIHSWRKYNNFFFSHHQRQAARAKWRKARAAEAEAKAKAEAEAKANSNGGAPKNLTPTQQLYAINQQLEVAQGDEKKQLLKRKRELLRATTGIEKDKPQPQSRQGLPETARESEDTKSSALLMARTTLKDVPDALSETMVRTLHDAGDHLPAMVKKKFAKLLEQLGDRNPVPA